MGNEISRADEAREAYRRYVEERGRAERGEIPWSAVAEGFFTEDAVFVDPAWGRIEGHAAANAKCRGWRATSSRWTQRSSTLSGSAARASTGPGACAATVV